MNIGMSFSLQQVFEHTESTSRHYALGEGAKALGWAEERKDRLLLGRSGTISEAELFVMRARLQGPRVAQRAAKK